MLLCGALPVLAVLLAVLGRDHNFSYLCNVYPWLFLAGAAGVHSLWRLLAPRCGERARRLLPLVGGALLLLLESILPNLLAQAKEWLAARFPPSLWWGAWRAQMAGQPIPRVESPVDQNDAPVDGVEEGLEGGLTDDEA